LIPAVSRPVSRRLAALLAACIVAAPAWSQQSQPAPSAQSAPRVKFATSAGEFTVELYPDKAPKTVENFLQYVRDKHYDGTVFHRVIDGFMVQGGGFNQQMQQKPTRPPIPLEAKADLKNGRGTLAMARTSNPDSATAQFFVNVVDNRNLDAPNPDGHGYAVFGRVVSGMETIDKIRTTPTGTMGPFQNVPATPVVIQSATISK